MASPTLTRACGVEVAVLASSSSSELSGEERTIGVAVLPRVRNSAGGLGCGWGRGGGGMRSLSDFLSFGLDILSFSFLDLREGGKK